ncbi:hypothetical protein ABW21_db0202542 [Orbilia brochopaga]|nr:hypothetical protein ABW21_db0202542 [Drechslerella brochopaga]
MGVDAVIAPESSSESSSSITSGSAAGVPLPFLPPALLLAPRPPLFALNFVGVGIEAMIILAFFLAGVMGSSSSTASSSYWPPVLPFEPAPPPAPRFFGVGMGGVSGRSPPSTSWRSLSARLRIGRMQPWIAS